MKNVLTFVTMAAFSCCLVSFGLAEDKKATKSPDNKKVETKTDATASAGLRAEIHRTMADLIEAQSAEQPDQAKIDKLTQKLQQLRGQLQAQAQGGGWTCPWGGPGMGFGRGAGWGGAGMGFGRGAAWGGPGKGVGWGRGAGFGRGAGRGPGSGMGRGFGPGGGMGLAPGGPGFVDQDNDGICDWYELRHGVHK